MAKALGEVVREARQEKGWTLREAADATGIHNAHLSQIESGKILQPGQAILWTLAETYDLDFTKLLRLAGHTTKSAAAGRRSLAGAVLRSLDDLTDDEQRALLAYMEQMKREQGDDD